MAAAGAIFRWRWAAPGGRAEDWRHFSETRDLSLVPKRPLRPLFTGPPFEGKLLWLSGNRQLNVRFARILDQTGHFAIKPGLLASLARQHVQIRRSAAAAAPATAVGEVSLGSQFPD